MREAVRLNVTVLVVVAGLGYALLAGWAMANVGYDVWGAIVVVPIMALFSVPMVRHTFRGELRPLANVALVGLAAKLVGTLLRYWVVFGAYGGAADADQYHNSGRLLAGDVHSGVASFVDVIPHAQGTQFIQQLTGFLYTFVGASRLAGFLWFGLIGYWGVVFYVKAACLAVPGLAQRRYALLCFLAPSLVFWPSSIGKEAWMCLCLGLISFGAATLWGGRWHVRSLLPLVGGAVGAALVRPHFAFIWLGALFAALVVGVVVGRSNRAGAGRVVQLGLGLLAVVGLVLVARVTISYLSPGDEQTSVGSAIDKIGEETSLRSTSGGSSFAPVVVAGPADYPTAIWRTLTRPLLHEATGLTSLIPALETTALVLIAALGWRRLVSVPRAVLTTPYVTFCFLVTLMCGLALSRFGNLAILVRQRSLVWPPLLVLLCLPAWRPRPRTPSAPQFTPARRAGRPQPTMSRSHG